MCESAWAFLCLLLASALAIGVDDLLHDWMTNDVSIGKEVEGDRVQRLEILDSLAQTRADVGFEIDLGNVACDEAF